ncbi:MAG: IPT/TIG domain-containing protein, partial [Dysgonamonadaceae bacterium]|nr:IPT/TIG domain-containing protein [Dysgonamonadaceae bacterium]
AACDQKRYIAPPIVTIDDEACEDVVVFSPNFLMCKVPESKTGTGDRNILIKSSDGLTTYASIQNGYTYVDNSSFYISSISSIIGGAGKVITFTGNKLSEITEVKAGNKVWTIQSKTSTTCVCKLPDDLGGLKGEVDITIALSGGDSYRFARMFEYN